MIANLQSYTLAPQEYLDWEPTQETRYEYVEGEIYAMTGGTKAHNRISGNLYTALDTHLNGSDCEVYIADVKVQVAAANAYFYPDVVTCDPKDRDSSQLVQYPRLIIEVLSPSTEAYDRGSKFAQYRKLGSLQEYGVVQSDQMGVERFHRNAEGLWVLHPYEAGSIVSFASVGLTLPIESIYRQVSFEATETQPES